LQEMLPAAAPTLHTLFKLMMTGRLRLFCM